MKRCKLIKKLTSAAVCAAMLLGIFCSGTAASAATTTPSGYISVYEQEISAYSGAIDALAEGMRNRQEQINISSYRVPIDKARVIFEAVINKNPELFYVAGRFGYNYYQNSGNNYIYALNPSYLYARDEVNEMMAEFDKKSEYYLSKITPDMSEFEKALILHDELILNSSYLLDGSTYTLMVDGTGKCEDYSRAYAFLLANAGIKSEMMLSSTADGNTQGMNHQWVKVRIDGSYYHVDPTWDDPVVKNASWYQTSGEARPNGYTGMVFHTYFLVSDELIGTNSLGRPHTGYTTFYPSPQTYDNAAFRDVTAPFCYVDGTLYTVINNSSGNTALVSYNPQADSFSELTSMSLYWSTPSGGYWVGSFSGLNYLDGLFYFNGPSKVYTYDLATGQTAEFASKPGNDNIYGINIINRDLYAYTTSTPSELRDGHLLAHIDEPLPPLAPGDVDANGYIDIRDATAVQRHLAMFITLDQRQLAAADFNGDSKIDVDDATDIQKYIAHII